MSEENNKSASSASASAAGGQASAAATAASTGKGPVFAIKRIFLRDLSFETPIGLEAFNMNSAPKVAQDLNTEIDKIDEQHYQATLKITITVKTKEDKVAYLVEVHQSGIFQITGFNNEQVKHILTVQCPTVLYPYSREAIDSVVVKGGFPPLALPPINFDAVIAMVAADAQARAASATASAEGNA